MKLEHTFRVDAAVDEAWRVLLDIERIAPCMPGAQLQEVHGDEYRGVVKVKVGPITAQYKGVARVTHADETAGQLSISAEGRDTRGQGNASATISAQLTPDGTGTRVVVDTDLNVTGKVAQFGRGVMADVSTKLLGQFVDCLSTTILGPDAGGGADPTPAAPTPPTPTSGAPGTSGGSNPPSATPAAGPRRVEGPEAEAVDLMRAAGGAVAKRLVPLLAVAAVLIGVAVWLITR